MFGMTQQAIGEIITKIGSSAEMQKEFKAPMYQAAAAVGVSQGAVDQWENVSINSSINADTPPDNRGGLALDKWENNPTFFKIKKCSNASFCMHDGV